MENNIKSYFLRHGMIYAIISILLTLLLYLAGPDFFASNMFMFSGLFLLIALIYPIVIVIQFRKQNGNEMTFKQGFLITFFTLAIAGLVTLAFGILLYNVIDKDYPVVLAEKINERTATMMQNFGMPEDQIQEQMEKSDAGEKFTIGGQVQGYLISLAVYAVLGLIIGAIFKRARPVAFDSPN